MGGILNYDSPLMSGLARIADLVILNVLTFLFCIPIVTIGASVTACHYVSLKLKRGEGYVMRNFWKSFKENLGQSTVIWFVVAINISIYLIIILFFRGGGIMGDVAKGASLVALILWAFVGCWVFPLQSKFINKIRITIKNSFLLAFRYLFRTIFMVVINLLPVILFLVMTLTMNFQWCSLLLLFGFSVPAYLCAMLYDQKFQEIEDMILEREASEVAEEGAN